MTTTKEPRARVGFTAEERSFIVSMFQAGVAACRGWLSPEQGLMAVALEVRLAALPLARARADDGGGSPRQRRHKTTPTEPAQEPTPGGRMAVAPSVDPLTHDPLDIPAELRR